MSSNKSTASSSGGIGFVGLLTIAFIILKVTGFINWDWIWVLSPLWISFILAVIFIAIVVAIAVFLDSR